MRKLIPLIFLLVCGCLFCGCATRYNVNVDGLNSGSNATLGAYSIILPANATIASDLAFNEFSIYVADALTRNGYKVTASAAQAQTGILMSYGIGDPLERINGSPSMSFGTGFYHGWGHGRHWGWGFGPSFYFPLNDISSYTTYASYLSLSAYDINHYQATGNMVFTWQLSVFLRSASSDLRATMPILVAAAMPYIGHNTGRQIVVTISADDPYVQELERMAPASSIPQRTDYTRPQ